MRRVALYVRVSTADQTTENQERELIAIAARMGWEVVCIYKDEGISGAKGRDKRPALNAMLKDVTRRKFDMVMGWSVDRLDPPPLKWSTLRYVFGQKEDRQCRESATSRKRSLQS